MLAALALFIPPTLYLGIRRRANLFFCGATIVALGTKIMDYVVGLLLYQDVFKFKYFIIYLLGSTLEHVLMTAAIYLCLARIVVLYGYRVGRVYPRMYTILFFSFDNFSLAIQSVGGWMAAVALLPNKVAQGTRVLVAGLAMQLFSLLCFMVLVAEYARRVHKYRDLMNPKDAARSTNFKIFLCYFSAAKLCIFIRCNFRTTELSNGFGVNLVQNQETFMVFDGALVLLACILLTVMHPAVCFRETWAEATARNKFWKNIPDFKCRKEKSGSSKMWNWESGTENGSTVMMEDGKMMETRPEEKGC